MLEKGGEGMAVKNMTRCGLFAALLCVCAWLSLPLGGLVISLQSFGLFLALGTLGGKRGTVCVAVYLALGAVGLPVFTGFQSGFGALLGPTGGYLWGFLAAALVYWGLEKRLPRWICMALGMAVCYACGTAWYLMAFGGGFFPVLALCVLPYLLPDAIKLGLALLLSRRLEKFA